MYNISTHYNNIFELIKSITPEPAIIYLHPHGSTEIENIEHLLVESNDQLHIADAIVICYDQEPLMHTYNKTLFEYINDKILAYRSKKKVILLNTELDGDDKDKILSDYNYIDCYYFHHAFAANDWFREYYYNKSIINPSLRKLSKKFITMNRLTSYARVYRTLLINELITHDILDQGYVSYSKTCPYGGTFELNLIKNQSHYNIPTNLIKTTISNINNSDSDFRIDFKEEEFIPNRSFSLDPIPVFNESFLHIVTETNYWNRRKHLTEKIFKPIILKQPFVLVGCAYNLEYLKSYGFKTFNTWWDESYDNIENDIDRMHAIGHTLKQICSYSLPELEEMLKDMEETLNYNHNLFFSRDFINSAWQELETNLISAISQVNSQ